MKAKELIRQLQQVNPEAEVMIGYSIIGEEDYQVRESGSVVFIEDVKDRCSQCVYFENEDKDGKIGCLIEDEITHRDWPACNKFERKMRIETQEA